ncbi:MAG: hypothetical protein R3296_11425 [Oleiphilaceae bacterium]|nr:hypothetical protein [Oleiphilaceae bacterium]
MTAMYDKESRTPSWRPMSVTSEVFYHLGRTVNANSACIFRIRGELDRAVLRQSIDKLVERHPLLRSVMQSKGRQPGWRSVRQEVVIDEIALEAEGHHAQMEEMVNAAWCVQFREGKDIPLRVHLSRVRGATYLQLVTSHIAEDARASYQISHDLVRIYNGIYHGNAAALAFLTPVNPPNRSMDRYFFVAGLAEKLMMFLGAVVFLVRDLFAKDISNPLDRKAEPQYSPDFTQRGLEIRELPETLFQRLREAAKQNRSSVHSLMLLALSRLIWRNNQDHQKRQVRLVDMFSLRPLGKGECDSLYENVVMPYFIRIKPGGDQDMLQQIMRRINGMKSGGHLVEYFRYRLMIVLVRRIRDSTRLRSFIRKVVKSKMIVTNPGQIPFALEKFGDSVIDEFFTYAQLFPPGITMCQFSGFRDRIRLIMLYDKSCFGVEEKNRFLDDYFMELEKL